MNRNKSYLKQIFLAFLLVGVGFSVKSQDWDAKARELVSKMTLPEKLQELHGIRDATNYRYVPPIPRLHIPALRVANGPAGVGPAGAGSQAPATALPAPILLAATWDLDLAKRYGTIIGKECKALNEDLLEGPDVNIARVPQGGRTFEAFGEDPWLVSQIGVAVIQGIQSQNIIANIKHFVANNQETERFKINEIIGERALHEIYLPAFEAAVKKGHVGSLMAAYPKINGTYNCENSLLLNNILKQDWGFGGFVTSDFDALHSTVPSALAGLDLEMPTGVYFGSALEKAVTSGQVPISIIDDKLVRRFRVMMQFGLFDDQPTPHPIPAREHGIQARHLAEQGMVLLKNEGNQLPLDPARLKSIAIIGPYATKAITGGDGSSHVVPLYTVAPVKGIEQRVGPKVKVEFDDGRDISKAVDIARHADVAVVMVGDHEAEGSDHSLSFAGNQNELVEAVATANAHTVVVLKTGTAMLLPWANKVPAILEAWYPGEEDGNSVASVLFGDVNPSGKLPLTFPKQLSDLPADTPEQYPGVNGVVNYSEGIFVGYRHFDAKVIQPLFPFGYGLSYTTFSYKNLTIAPESISTDLTSDKTISVELDVTNTGKRSGQEVVELYVGFPTSSSVPEPPKQLKGFVKVPLQPGETRHLQLELSARSFAYWNTTTHTWKIMPGKYRILLGASSRDIRLQSMLSARH